MASRLSKRTVNRLSHQGADTGTNSNWADIPENWSASKLAKKLEEKNIKVSVYTEKKLLLQLYRDNVQRTGVSYAAFSSKDKQASDLKMADNMAAIKQQLAALQASVAALTASHSSWSPAAEDTCQSVLARRVKDNTRLSQTLHNNVPDKKFPPVDNIPNVPSSYGKIISDKGLTEIANAMNPSDLWQLLIFLGLSDDRIRYHHQEKGNLTLALAGKAALSEWRNNNIKAGEKELVRNLLQELESIGRVDVAEAIKTICKQNRFPSKTDFQH